MKGIHRNVIIFLDFSLHYLSYSQIWLNPLATDRHYGNIITGKKKKKEGKMGFFFFNIQKMFKK